MDKELLFRPRLPEDDIEVEGIGTMRVRALSRLEAMHVQDATDVAERDRRILAQGLVDPMLMIPGMKHGVGPAPCAKCADAGRWQEAAPAGEAEPVSVQISIMSGMMEGSAKQAVKDFEAEPETEFRVLPSEQAGDDGSPTEGGDI